MDTHQNRNEVVVYPPPSDGLPYAVVAIGGIGPEIVSFEETFEQATVIAEAVRAMWSCARRNSANG